jgi:hypothetical protein
MICREKAQNARTKALMQGGDQKAQWIGNVWVRGWSGGVMERWGLAQTPADARTVWPRLIVFAFSHYHYARLAFNSGSVKRRMQNEECSLSGGMRTPLHVGA